MDILMPRVNGIAATKQIKAADPIAKIVIVSNYDDDTLRKAAMAAGACGFALKDSLPDLLPILKAVQGSLPDRT